MVPRVKDPDEMASPIVLGRKGPRGQSKAAPDKAFAFLSKSFVDAQRSAEIDFKLITARTQSLRKMVPSAPALEQWEKIKIPLSGKEVTAGELLQQLKENGRRALASPPKPLALEDWEKIRIPIHGGREVTAGEFVRQLQDSGRKALERPLVLEDLDVVKSLQQRIPPALSKLQKRLPEALPGLALPPPPSAPSIPPQTSEESGLPTKASPSPSPFSFLTESGDAPSSWSLAGLAQRDGQEPAAKAPEQGPRGKNSGWQQLLPPRGDGKGGPLLMRPFQGRQFLSLEDWNRAVKEHKWKLPVPSDSSWEPLKIMADGLKELQEQAANPKVGATNLAMQQKSGVRALTLPEVLMLLAQTSEEVLGTFGVKPVPKIKMGSLQPAGSRVKASADTLSEGALERRLAEVMESTGYQHKEDGVNSFGRLLRRYQLALAGNPRALELPRNGKKRSVAIVTTASLPWMTGTAVNPLLRAAYLAQLGNQEVTLLVPWLTKEDQKAVYPGNITFDSPVEQEAYVRQWLLQRVGFSPNIKITFYPGKFSREKRSILAAGDISQLVPEGEADIAVLEEPEHLTWYYHGRRWTDKFKHVVGIIHTNYLEYVKREKNGLLQAALLEHVNNWMVRIYCDKVVRLSAATQNFPKASVCNVHGVGVKFLEIGDAMAQKMGDRGMPFSKGAYYLGKMVWSKGYRELVDLLALNHEELGGKLTVDVYGSGEDVEEVRAEAVAKGLRMQFHKGRDHADTTLHGYKVFINPSISDVVCTTTAEALAMGKMVVCADHPSNDFFRSFPNCLIYKDSQEFVSAVQMAMATEPKPLTPEQRQMLTWEAATQRFLRSAGLESLAHTGSLASSDASVPESTGLEALSPRMSGISGVRRVRSCEDFQGLAAQQMAAFRPRLASRAPASLSLSLSSPDLANMVDRFLSLTHFMASGVEAARYAAGAPPGTMHIEEQLSKELGLPPVWVQRPTYGW